MSDNDKRAEYVRRAEEARDAAKASANDQLKMVLYQIARLWDRMSGRAKVLLVVAPAAAVSGCLTLSECCIRMHFHCSCCWWHV